MTCFFYEKNKLLIKCDVLINFLNIMLIFLFFKISYYIYIFNNEFIIYIMNDT